MNNDDYENELDKTKSLNDLSDLIAKETEDYLPKEEIKEEVSKEQLYNDLTAKIPKITEEVPKKYSLKEKWQSLSKQQQIIIIASFLFILIFSIIITFIVLLNEPQEKEPPVIEEPSITIDNGNYRYEDGILKFLNNNKTEIGSYECSNKEEDLCYVAYLNNEEDNFDTVKNIYLDDNIIKVRSNIYNNRYVFLVDGEASPIKLYDILEQKIIGEYLSIKAYNEDNYVVLEDKNNKFGLVEITSNEVKNIIDFTYNYMGIIPSKDNIVVKTNKASYLIDYNNKYITKQINGEIIDYNETYLLIKNNNTYQVVDYNNQKLLENDDYMRLISEEYVALIKDNNLYIRGYGNNKYNEVGYRLYNNDYTGTNTYDLDGILKKSNYSFKVEINNSLATIYIKNGDKTEENTLNLKDGEASSYQKYYSYLDGVLYFYNDEAKEELLGSYPCQNKNIFTDSIEFNHCLVAYDNQEEYNFKNQGSKNHNLLPIYNNRFVFITDNQDLNNSDIKLYDFNSNKVIATYSLVNANVNNNDGILTHINNEAKIIVKNKSNKYGMISLSNTGLSKIYDFIYDEMERIGEYLEVKENNQYKIMFQVDSVSKSYPGKIYDFNNSYYIIKENNGYAIYDKNGTKKINKNYKFIKMLGDSCFGYIDTDNKLYLSLYDGTILNTVGIDIDVPNNELDYLKLYTLTKLNDEVIVNVFNLDGTKKSTQNITLAINDINSNEEVENATEE